VPMPLTSGYVQVVMIRLLPVMSVILCMRLRLSVEEFRLADHFPLPRTNAVSLCDAEEPWLQV
jgi:hypothetical protein